MTFDQDDIESRAVAIVRAEELVHTFFSFRRFRRPSGLPAAIPIGANCISKPY